MERRLTAILAADVVGYSALMERDEAGTYARLRAGRRELFEPEIERHHGRIFKLMGDGLLADFSSVVDAVECAVALQRGLAERNAAVPEAERIEVRMGINLGEVIVEGEDRYGEGVNVASRLEQLAEPGGIWVSAKVAREVEKKLAFGFERMGMQRVKNIAEPVEAFRIKLDTAPATAVRPRRGMPDRRVLAALLVLALIIAAPFIYLQWLSDSRTTTGKEAASEEGPALPSKPSIAVLPFTNLSDDAQQGYFADGIAEDLMTDLSKVSGLFVVSRNSTFSYKGKNVDVRQVARELGVRYILEGSVRRSNDLVRINVQLIDATTGGHEWAERYDGSQSDIFALQDKVTKAVVEALALELSSGEQAAIAQHETNVPEAYDAFLRGWENYRRTTPEGFALAKPDFERAIALDPDYGRAHAALAMIYFRSYDQRWSGRLGLSTEAAFRKARDHLKLASARPTSTSHQVAGNISRGRGWYDDALKEFNAAIAIDPSDAWNYAELAHTLIWAGRPAEAVSQIDAAMRLDPHFPAVFVFYKGLAQFAQDNYPEAAKVFEEALRLDADLPWLRLFLASTYNRIGRDKEAAALINDYNTARVKLGGLPFVMMEVQWDDVGGPQTLKPPEKNRLISGLRPSGIPYNFDDKSFAGLQLSGKEIDALFFSHRIHGRTLGTGLDHGMYVSADGASAMIFGDWGNGDGRAYVEKDRLCIARTSMTSCGLVFRNPGGMRVKENEYFWFDGWAYPFSQVE